MANNKATRKKPPPCSICGGSMEPWANVGYGNNAEPVIAGGRCCNECNRACVIPVRSLIMNLVLTARERKGAAAT